MASVKTKEGSIQKTPDGILKTVKEFYKGPYTAKARDESATNTLLGKVSRKLKPKKQERCEGPILEKELKLALKHAKNGKSDGIPVGIYKVFWSKLGNAFTAVVNSCFEAKNLTLSQKIGLITCLFKKGDREDLKNWCPFSLLNVDYKLIAKVLSNRLAKVLRSLIAEDQTCAVPGGTILGTCHVLRDLIQLCEEDNLPIALLSIDQMKAFDRVN